ncbi:MAG: hypothetical protein FWG98_08430 [Candidatus Cloacimonetes bacterium]|nr:hypothetical protein [Candidatus Cloacimonadota bacterium]
MISLDWKARLLRDSVDFLERKVPHGDYHFDIIYNAYPNRLDNRIPRDVIVFVANTLGAKMSKKHKDYLPFCDFIWKHKGSNGRIAFACIISKFIRKDYKFYFEYTKKTIKDCKDSNEINLLMDKVFFPILKNQQLQSIDTIVNWLKEDNDKLNQALVRTVLKIGKDNKEYLLKLIDRLEFRWLDASPEFAKANGLFLKSLAKVDYETYLGVYKNYSRSREPIYVEILTQGLVNYDDTLYEIFYNWSKSGNARLKKSANNGLKYLKKRKD